MSRNALIITVGETRVSRSQQRIRILDLGLS